MRLYKLATPKIIEEINSKYQSLNELHDFLSIEIAKLPSNEYLFPIPEHIKRRIDMQIQNFNMNILSKYSDLKKYATVLKNCGAGYKNSLGVKEQIVGVTDSKGKIVAMLDIKEGKIVQAKIFDNEKASLIPNLNQALIEFSEKAKLKIKTNDIDISKTIANVA